MTSYDKSNFTLFAHAWLNKWQICDYQEDKKGSMIMVSGKCAGVVIYLLGYLFYLIIYLSILRLKEKYSKCQERKQLVNLTFFDCLGPNSRVCVCVCV